MPGLFLSLDGIDGTGKSTQCRLLVDWLKSQGFPVVHCIDPGGTPLGEQLREILLNGKDNISMRAEALLFMASRAELVAREILPALTANQIVVSDRYLLATVVYQGHAGQLPVEELWQVGRMATGGIEPDLTLVLDLPVEDAIRRRGRDADRMESRTLEYHRHVRDGFLTEVRRHSTKIHLVNAQATIDVIQERIRQQVLPLIHTFRSNLAGASS